MSYNANELPNKALFTTIIADRDELTQLHQQLAKQAVWTRFCGDTHNCITQHLSSPEQLTSKNHTMPAWLRFSLPGDHLMPLQETLESL